MDSLIVTIDFDICTLTLTMRSPTRKGNLDTEVHRSQTRNPGTRNFRSVSPSKVEHSLEGALNSYRKETVKEIIDVENNFCALKKSLLLSTMDNTCLQVFHNYRHKYLGSSASHEVHVE